MGVLAMKIHHSVLGFQNQRELLGVGGHVLEKILVGQPFGLELHLFGLFYHFLQARKGDVLVQPIHRHGFGDDDGAKVTDIMVFGEKGIRLVHQ